MIVQPCPFCGNDKIQIFTNYADYQGRMCGFCEQCGTWGPGVPIDYKDIKGTKAKAVELWNTRHKNNKRKQV